MGCFKHAKRDSKSSNRRKRRLCRSIYEYYCHLVNEYGGKLTAKWVFGMVIYDGKRTKEYTWSKSHFYFVNQPCKKRIPGYPLDSISIMPENNKYFVDLTEEERKTGTQQEDDVIEFLVNKNS